MINKTTIKVKRKIGIDTPNQLAKGLKINSNIISPNQ